MAIDKLVDSTQLNSNLTSIANAIRTKTGTSTQLSFPNDFISSIENIQTGAEAEPLTITANGTYIAPTGTAYSPITVNVPNGDITITDSIDTNGGIIRSITTNTPTIEPHVNFYDYDGTLLYSYTHIQFNALSTLPSNPTHAGLISQGWNWTREQIITSITTNPYNDIDVGQMYITDDNATRLYCTFSEERKSPLLSLSINGTVTVDWGDGTSTDTMTGNNLTSYTQLRHGYATSGDYVISIYPSANTTFCAYTSNNDASSYHGFFRGDTNANILSLNTSYVYLNSINKVELGSNCIIRQYMFAICRNLETITIPSGITEIGQHAFSGTALKSITIPNTVTSIGDYGLSTNYQLTSVSLPCSLTSIGIYLFYNNPYLKTIAIPYGITNIPTYSFSVCSSLYHISLPNTITSIDAYAFNQCYALAKILIPSNITSIGAYAFQRCGISSVLLSASTLSIGARAFSECRSLTSVKILGNCTLGSYVFNACTALNSVVFSNEITSIPEHTFDTCYALISVNLPTSLTTIGDYAFVNCYSLKSIAIPNTVTSIGNYAFRYCTSLTSLDFQNSNLLTNIGQYAFSSTGIESLIIPNSVTSIGQQAFAYCYALKTVSIPNTTSLETTVFSNCTLLSEINIPTSMTSIPSNLFYYCCRLKEIILPNNITTIGQNAFSNCHTVTTLTIPNNVATIDKSALASMHGLKKLYLKSTTPPTLANASVGGSSDMIIYVPYSSDHSILTAYQTATNWSSYASYMQEESI